MLLDTRDIKRSSKMIFESSYWKADLLRRASLLRKNSTQKRWSERSFAKCEQTVMIGFYAIRKLIEAKKLTDEFTETPVQMQSYRPTGTRATRLNNHKPEELYDLANSEQRELSLLDLCNQVIHSYIFMPVLDECGALVAILVTSDRQRSKGLFHVEAHAIVTIFEQAANDEVGSIHAEFEDSIGDYRIKSFPFKETP